MPLTNPCRRAGNFRRRLHSGERKLFRDDGHPAGEGASIHRPDTADSAPVTVINESLARRIWPGEDPLGKRLKQVPENDRPARSGRRRD